MVNFLNKKNAGDQRVYQLLDEKFKLFSGVFGASDEVLSRADSLNRFLQGYRQLARRSARWLA